MLDGLDNNNDDVVIIMMSSLKVLALPVFFSSLLITSYFWFKDKSSQLRHEEILTGFRKLQNTSSSSIDDQGSPRRPQTDSR